MKLKKYRFCVYLLLLTVMFHFALPAKAQDAQTEDSTGKKSRFISTPAALGDTVWLALQHNSDQDLLSLVPGLDVLKATFDSLEIKNNPQVIRLKYNFISYRVSKQLKGLKRKASAEKIRFKTCELEQVRFQEGKDEKNNAFAYVYLEGRKSKKTFRIQFVALQLNGYWYVADELKLVFPEEDPFYKPPVKVKKK